MYLALNLRFPVCWCNSDSRFNQIAVELLEDTAMDVYHMVLLPSKEYLVVSSVKYENDGSIVASGDFESMTQMLHKLQSGCHVKLDLQSTKGDDSQTPKVQQSKYTFSDDDDCDFTPSTKSYVPSSESSEDYEIDSDLESDKPTTPIKRSIAPELGRRRLFADDSEDSTTQVSESEIQSSSSGVGIIEGTSKPVDKIVATITIQQDEVTITVPDALHLGKYYVDLFPVRSANGEEYLEGSIIKKVYEKHTCESAAKSSAVCQTVRKNNALECKFVKCCGNRLLVGIESTFDLLPDLRLATLCLPTSKELVGGGDLDSVPAKGGAGKHKVHCCIYCGKMIKGIPRHLMNKHSEEAEVKAVLSLGPAKRQEAFIRLRKRGDRAYNDKVPRERRIPYRNPLIYSVSDCIHCDNCDGLFSKKNFSKHHLRCTKRHPDKMKRTVRLEVMDREGRKPSGSGVETSYEATLKVLLRDLKNDEISDIIKNDPIIQDVGVVSCQSVRDQRQHHNARSHMRRLARLLLALREIDPSVVSLVDWIDPKRYDTVLEAIRIICRSDPRNPAGDVANSSLAKQYGPLISQVIHRVRKKKIINMSNLNALEAFEKLHSVEFNLQVGRNATTRAEEKKIRNKRPLPSTVDINKLTLHLKTVLADSMSQLNRSFNHGIWRKLGEVLLSKILLFNRRRPGELSWATLQDYQNKRLVTDEERKYMNRLEKLCADHFTMIQIKGKRGRVLGTLLQPEEVKGLDLLLSYREEAGIPPDNQYLFASLHKAGHLAAARALKVLAHQCGVNNPELLTGTNLRKQAATMCQLFSLDDNQMKQVSDFMGHSRTVHEQNYRLPEQINQITKISRFLSVVSDEDLFAHKGKSFDELQMLFPTDEEFHDCDQQIDVPTGEFREDDFLEWQPSNFPSHGQPEDEPSNSTHLPKDQLETPGPSTLISSYQPDIVKTPEKLLVRRPACLPSASKASISPRSRRRYPNMMELLQTLSPKAKTRQKKKAWSASEVAFMKKTFAKFLNAHQRMPDTQLLERVLRENPQIFDSCRNRSSLYSWIQYRRVKGD